MAQLAFVLEAQTELVQSKLLAWVLMTLAFRVAHFAFFYCTDVLLLTWEIVFV
jgi:hypothetical protein